MGNGKLFSCRGIKIVVQYFKKRGHHQITAFVPQWRRQAPRGDKPIVDQHILEELRDEGVLVFTPSRKVEGRNIVSYDDRFASNFININNNIKISYSMILACLGCQRFDNW